MACKAGGIGPLIALLVLTVGTTVLAAEPSGCVSCHLDKEKLTQNASAESSGKSALQSGAG